MQRLRDLTPEQRLDLGEKLREMSDEQKMEFIESLSPEQQLELQYDPIIHLRRKQWVPPDDENNICLLLAGRGFGKDLCDTTPIFTKNKGWIKIGDVQKGDIVFDERGDPTNVVDVYKPEPRQLYKFTFSDGTSLVSSCEHDWITWENRDRKAYLRSTKTEDSQVLPKDWVHWKGFTTSGKETGTGPKKKTTQDIIDTFTVGKRKDRNHSIPCTFPLQMDEKCYPIDPYQFGIWLGDGLSNGSGFSCGEQDLDHLSKYFDITYYRKESCFFRVANTFQPDLDALGVLNDKHIPDEYLYGSETQRLDLLQGLMDSDGYAGNSHVEFCSKTKDLAQGVLWLARSLGEKPVISEGRAKLNGRDYGTKYRVTWKPSKHVPFKLERKRKNVFLKGKQSFRNFNRMIIAYEPVDYKPTTCIAVDNDSHLFLAGESLIPTHNTFTISRMLKWYVEEKGIKDFVIAAPSSNDLVQTIWAGPAGIERSYANNDPNKPTYSPHFNVIKYPNGAVGRMVSSESPERSRGISSQLIIADELGSFSGNAEEFWENLEYGLRLTPSQAIIATTPRATPLMQSLVERGQSDEENVRIVTGSTLENNNLTKQMLDKARRTMHTRIGRREVLGELILTNEGACWTPELIDQCKVDLKGEFHPSNWKKGVIACDPAGESTAKSSDAVGICAGVVTNSDKIIILKDKTARMTGMQAVETIAALYNEYSEICPMKVVVEKNGVGGLFKSMFKRDYPMVPISDFTTVNKKYARAVACAHKYETGIAFNDKNADLTLLEKEMTSYDGTGKSPNALDSCCFVVSELSTTGNFVTKKKFIL